MKRAAVILVSGVLVSALILAGRWAAHLEGESAREALADRSGTLSRESAGPAPLKRGDPIPEATLLTQDGRPVSLSAFKGRPLVLSFIYTRCPMTTMCPMATRKLKQAQALARESRLDAQFLIISFDPEDTPEVLRDYARRNEVDLSNWTFATGPREVLGPLARLFNTYYRQAPGGSFEHNIVISIVDSRGRLRDDFFGTDWDPAQFLRALQEANP